MRIAMAILGIMMLAAAPSAYGQSPEDSAAVREAALDYIEGWYEGNAERMDKALHADLAKRAVRPHPQTGGSLLTHLTESMMVEFTKAGGGSNTPPEDVHNEVVILDIYNNIASVRAESLHFVDYLHIVKWNDEWVILNVLWENR
jgi:hypothetical protein